MVEDIHMPKPLVSSDLMRKSGLLQISSPIEVREAIFLTCHLSIKVKPEKKDFPGKDSMFDIQAFQT